MLAELLRPLLEKNNITYQYAIPFELPQFQGQGYCLSHTVMQFEEINYQNWRKLRQDMAALGYMPILFKRDKDVDNIIHHHNSLLESTEPTQLESVLSTLPAHYKTEPMTEEECEIAVRELRKLNNNLLGLASKHMSQEEKEALQQTFLYLEQVVKDPSYEENNEINQNDDEEKITLSQFISELISFSPDAIQYAVAEGWLPTDQVNQLVEILSGTPLTLAQIESLHNAYKIDSGPLEETDLLYILEEELSRTAESFIVNPQLKQEIIEKIESGVIQNRFDIDRYLFVYEQAQQCDALNQEKSHNLNHYDYVMHEEVADNAFVMLLLPIHVSKENVIRAILNFHQSILTDYHNLPAALLMHYLTEKHQAELVGFPNSPMFFHILLEKPLENSEESYQLAVLSEKIFGDEALMNDLPCRELARIYNYRTTWILGSSYH